MQIKTIDFQNTSNESTVDVDDSIYNKPLNEGMMHQVITSIMAGRRQGSKAQKTRSQVSGGGAKPWRQKGTGRARAGTTRSPIWRTGGVTFAAAPRSYNKKINKKEYRAVFQGIIAEMLRTGRLQVFSNLKVDTHKTKDLASSLNNHGLSDVLIVTDNQDNNMTLASRNLKRVDAITTSQLNALNMISHDTVAMSDLALQQLIEANAS